MSEYTAESIHPQSPSAANDQGSAALALAPDYGVFTPVSGAHTPVHFPTAQATSVLVAGAVLVTLFRNQFAKTKEERRLSLEAIAQIIEAERAAKKARLPWLKCARFGDKRSANDCLRNNANVLAITGVEGDHDNGRMPFEEAKRRARQSGVKMLLYTTASHTEANQRWRAIAVFSKELDPKQRDQMMNRLAGIFGEGVFAGESWTLSQAYHYGGITRGTPPQVFITNGDYIDLRDDLDATAIGKTRKAPASTATTAPIVNLTGGAPGAAQQSRLHTILRETRFPETTLYEIRAAAPHIPPMDYRPPTEGGYGWLDDLAFPMAAAIAWAPPKYKAELRRIFDETNRRTANPEKVAKWEAKNPGKDYFDSALKTLDKGAEDYWDRVEAGEKVSHFTQIFQVACANGWDGRTELHLRAANSNAGSSTTVVTGGATTVVRYASAALWVDDDVWDEIDIPKRPWVAPRYVLRGSVTGIVGPPSAAKSLLTLSWCCATALGKPHGDFHPAAAGNVIVYNVEDNRDEQRRRLSASLKYFNAAPNDIRGKLTRVGPSGIGTLITMNKKTGIITNTAAMNCLRSLIEDRKPSILIIDPLVELHDAEENDNTSMRAVIAEFRSLAVEFDMAVVLVHHTHKGMITPGDLDAFRGASSTGGAGRVAFTFLTMSEGDAEQLGIPTDRKTRSQYVRLDDAKQNYGPIEDAEGTRRGSTPSVTARPSLPQCRGGQST